MVMKQPNKCRMFIHLSNKHNIFIIFLIIFTEAGTAIDFGLLFPDMTKTQELLEEFLTADTVRILLGATIKPDMVRKYIDIYYYY